MTKSSTRCDAQETNNERCAVSKHKQHYWVHSEPVEPDPEQESAVIMGCVGKHSDPVEREVGFLCSRCFSRMRRMLIELPAIVIWLEAHYAASGSAGERVSGSREEPIPLRLDVLDLIGPQAHNSAKPFNPYTGLPEHQLGDPGIESFLRARSEQVHWDTGASWPEDHSVQGFVSFLAASLRWIVDQDWIDDFLTELNDIHQRARHLAPWHEEIRYEKNGVCDKCGWKALVTHIARGRVVCEKSRGGCGYDREQTEYEWAARGITA